MSYSGDMNKSIQTIRSFNRFYTNILGLHQKHLLHSEYTLPEVRILFEIFNSDAITAKDIREKLDIDKGYLSRLISKLEKRGLIRRKTADTDKRVSHIHVTALGNQEFNTLNRASSQQIASLTKHLSAGALRELTTHMQAIQSLLEQPHEH